MALIHKTKALEHFHKLFIRRNNQKCKGKIRKNGERVYCHWNWFTNVLCILATEIEAQKDKEYIEISPIKVSGFSR